MLTRVKNERGDTLIEVLFALAVFSLVAVGSLSIMNQGTASAQRALEITLVRQEMDAQAETLRFVNSAYISAYNSGGIYTANSPADIWHQITTSPNVLAAEPSFSGGAACAVPPNSFILDTHAVLIKPQSSISLVDNQFPYSQVAYNSTGAFLGAKGIWVQAVRGGAQTNSDYIDFHIRACWDSPGQSTPVTLATIVRLYEPIN